MSRFIVRPVNVAWFPWAVHDTFQHCAHAGRGAVVARCKTQCQATRIAMLLSADYLDEFLSDAPDISDETVAAHFRNCRRYDF
jgi:hypothetical protein